MHQHILDRSRSSGHVVSTLPLSPILFRYDEPDRSYQVRHIAWSDTERQDEYQRLRATTFVEQLGWNIPVDAQGRERDYYDCLNSTSIRTYGAYGNIGSTEHLLGGIRIFALQSWDDSMIFNEFRAAGMIPDHVISDLRTQYDCHNLLEVTRFCVRRGRWYAPFVTHKNEAFSCIIARDLTLATAFAMAEETDRPQSVILVDAAYFRVLRKSHFIFTEIYQGPGIALLVIDMWASIRAIRAAGEQSQADRMLALCSYQGGRITNGNHTGYWWYSDYQLTQH